MKFFIPNIQGVQREHATYAAIKRSLSAQLGAGFSNRAVFRLQYQYNGQDYVAEVGQPHIVNGEPVIVILHETARALYHVCTSSRGGMRGGSILIGDGSVSSVVDFEHQARRSMTNHRSPLTVQDAIHPPPLGKRPQPYQHEQAVTEHLARVISAYGTMEIDEAVQRAGVAAAADRCYIVAGLTPVPRRSTMRYGGWRFSLSHCGQPPVVISNHRFRRDAQAQLERVHRASSDRDLGDDGVFDAFIQELAAFGDQDAVGTS